MYACTHGYEVVHMQVWWFLVRVLVSVCVYVCVCMQVGVCVWVYVHICAPRCVCVCVCMWERGREREGVSSVLKVPCVFVVIIISSNVPVTWIILSLCSDCPAVHVFVYLCCSTQTFSQQNLPQPMKLVAWSSGPSTKLAAYEMWSANVNPRDITCASTATPRWWQPLTWKRSRALVVRFWRLWSFCTTKGSLMVRCWFFVWLCAIGRFSEAGLHEWMPFVIFCARSRKRWQRHF